MTVILSATPTALFLGACEACKRPVRARDEQTTRRYARLTCPECGKIVTGERLYATTTGEPCDGACMGATDPRCSCGCGGINHGKLYEERGEATESAIEKYRAAIAKREAEAAAKTAAAAATRRAAFQEWAADHEDVTAYLADPYEFDAGSDDPNMFLFDMAQLITRHRILTDNQAAAVRRCIEARRRLAERKAAEAAAAKPVPTGTAVEITGTIIYTHAKENPYGPGNLYRMLIKGDGWKVWSTIPSTVRSAVDNLSDLHGRAVTLTAAITATDDDPSIGNAKRPRKATLICSPAPVAAA